MWEIPLTMLIMVIGLLLFKRMEIESKQGDRKDVAYNSLFENLKLLEKEHAEYKQRVDSLSLRAGFKL